MNLGLSNKIVLVTGASRGIGASIAEGFVKEGARVIINLDTNFYQPTKVVLEYFWPRLVRGGILMLDDYGIVPGETKAVDEYFIDKDVRIQKLPLSMTPFFIVKG